MSDEHGMPLPSKNSPLPWAKLFDCDIEDQSNGLIVYECSTEIDRDFIVHAANWIVPCRDIVRRLAENEEMTADQWIHLMVNARQIWAEIQREAKGGGGDE